MDPISITGLAASVVTLLDLAIKTTSIIMELAKKYRNACEDMENAEWWLKRHKVVLNVWMKFWRISPGGYDYISDLWGSEGKIAITGHLRSLRNFTQRASDLQKQYSSELMRFSEKRRHRFLRKASFAFSGKNEFESVNELIRVQLDTLQSDAKTIFFQKHPSFNPGDLSGAAIESKIREIREVDNVQYVGKVSSTVLKTLTVPGIAEMELKLRRGFIGNETFTLATNEALLENTVKLPLILTVMAPSNDDGPDRGEDLTLVPVASQKLHTVVEFDDKSVHSSVEIHNGEERGTEFPPITHFVRASLSQASHINSTPAVYHLSREFGAPRLIFHNMFVDGGEEFGQEYFHVPERPLAHLFEELQALGGTDAFQMFPIRDRLELAYLLAVTVMNLHETEWLTKLCSRHVTLGREHDAGQKYCSLKVLGHDKCENGNISTPFDIFKNSALKASANVFSLGLLLQEIGTGQLIQRAAPVEHLAGWAVPWLPACHANILLLQTGNIISNTYASVVETCLKGNFDISTKEHFLSSYFAQVIQPLRELNSIHEPRRHHNPRPVQNGHSMLLLGSISSAEIEGLSAIDTTFWKRGRKEVINC